jgi:hypothetical protein
VNLRGLKFGLNEENNFWVMTLQELVESSNCRWLPKPSAIPGEELHCFWLALLIRPVNSVGFFYLLYSIVIDFKKFKGINVGSNSLF